MTDSAQIDNLQCRIKRGDVYFQIRVLKHGYLLAG